jgi:hypothetical protein
MNPIRENTEEAVFIFGNLNQLIQPHTSATGAIGNAQTIRIIRIEATARLTTNIP